MSNFSRFFKSGEHFFAVFTAIDYISLDYLTISTTYSSINYNEINNIVWKEYTKKLTDNIEKHIYYDILINDKNFISCSKDNSPLVKLAYLELATRVKAINSKVVYEENLLPPAPESIYINDYLMNKHEIVFYNDYFSFDEQKVDYLNITHAQYVPYDYAYKQFAIALKNIWWKDFRVIDTKENNEILENVINELKKRVLQAKEDAGITKDFENEINRKIEKLRKKRKSLIIWGCLILIVWPLFPISIILFLCAKPLKQQITDLTNKLFTKRK